MKKPHIVILGVGEIGSVLLSTFRKQKYSVDAWDKVPQKVPNQKSLFEIIPRADILFLCVPSWHLGGVVRSIGPFIHKQTVIVSFSKGLQQTKETPYTFLFLAFPNNEIVMVGGAMLAEEVDRGMPGIAVFGATKEATRDLVMQCFKNTQVVCFGSKDPEAICFSSVLKNIYALGLGMAHGIGWGGNGRALLARESLFEMEAIGKLLGVKRDTIYGPAGFVDLIATGFSEYSKNVEVGTLIVSSKKQIPLSEGLVSLEPMKKLIGSAISALPLFSTIFQAALRKEDAVSAFRKYVKRIEKRT